MKNLLEALGVDSEEKALAAVTLFNEFTESLGSLTGCAKGDISAMLGTVTAWKQASITDGKRKESEDTQVAVALASLAANKIGDCEKFKATYESDGFAAFIGAVDDAKTEHTEAKTLIDGLVSGGRLAPEARSAFDDLFVSNGLNAIKAAAAALPKKSQIKTGPAPKLQPDDGLKESERAKAVNMPPDQAKRFTALRLATRAKKGTK